METAGLENIGLGLMAFGLMGAAIGVGMIFAALLNGIARNPSAAKELRTNAFVGAGLAEVMGLAAMVIGFMLLFKIA